MSIATEITRIQNAKTDIKAAIENKGVDVGNGLINTYADKIAEISQGGDGDFWDKFQEYGNKADYRYAFAFDVWTDETYNPKYPIKQNGYAYTRSMFADSTKLTDTKVDIELLNTTSSNTGVFSGATNLVTIRKLILGGNAMFNGWFTNAKALTNITIEGSIDATIDFHFSPLSAESIRNVINALNSGTTGLTVSFSKAAVNKAFGIDIDDETTYPEGSEWYELMGSKSNWTLNFV